MANFMAEIVRKLSFTVDKYEQALATKAMSEGYAECAQTYGLVRSFATRIHTCNTITDVDKGSHLIKTYKTTRQLHMNSREWL